jgi:hypothetical protein
MRKILRGTAIVAALSLTGFTAHANCMAPGSGVQQSVPLIVNHGAWRAHESIVGTWRVTYSNGGVAFIQWHADGTEWENIDFPVLGGNLCLGEWKVLDRWHVSRNHYGWIYTDGIVSGYFNETETDLLSPDGNSYSGNNVTIFYNTAGTPVTAPTDPSPAPPPEGYPGTTSATRLFP